MQKSPKRMTFAMNAFLSEELHHESGVHLPDFTRARNHAGPAKSFRPQSVPLPAEFQYAVDQQFHRVDAGQIALTLVGSGYRQQHVAHAAYPRERIPEAAGDAGAENGADDLLGIFSDSPLTLRDVLAMRRDYLHAARVSSPRSRPFLLWQSRRAGPILSTGSSV